MKIDPIPNWTGTAWGWCPECRSGYSNLNGHTCTPPFDLSATSATVILWPLGTSR